MTKSDQDEHASTPGSGAGHRLKHAITLLLLVAAIVAGVAAYHSRQQWWDMYVSYKKLAR